MRIGLQVPGINDYFSLSIWHHAHERLKGSGHQLILLPVDSPKPKNSSVYRMSLYNFVSSENLDGIILSGSSFLNTLQKDEWLNFLQPFIDDIPTVSIGKTYQGIPMVCTSAARGIHQAVEHLVIKHGVQKIAFQKGCQGNPEAQERLECFKDALQKHHLPVKDEWIFPGEFIKRSGQELADILLESDFIPFEAIVVSNDAMAGALMDRLDENGVAIPEELKIIGFDNIPLSRFYSTPLATIEQPFKLQVDKALEIILSLGKGEKVPEVTTLNTTFIPRNSCGCTFESYRTLKELFQSDLSDELRSKEAPPADYQQLRSMLLIEEPTHQKMEAFIRKLEDSINVNDNNDSYENWSYYIARMLKDCSRQKPESFMFFQEQGLFHIAQYLLGQKHSFEKSREMNHFRQSTIEPLQRLTSDLSASLSKEEVFRNLENHILKLGFKNARVYLFEETEKEYYMQTPYGVIPPYSSLWMDFYQGRAQRINQQKNLFNSLTLLPDITRDVTNNFLVNPLYMQDLHFGFILMEQETGIDASIYEGIRLAISSSLQNLALMKELASANSQLESLLSNLKDSNTKLIIQSNHDSMTSLLNRRGFMQQAQNRMDTCSIQKVPYTLFFADMDGLKMINDTYGHKMGDDAIKAMAEILTRVFRREDLLARFGGDEFAVFSEGVPDDIIFIIRKRMNELLNSYNADSGKPYTLNLSIGYSGIHVNELESLEDLLHKADAELYEEKKKRKNSKNRKKELN